MDIEKRLNATGWRDTGVYIVGYIRDEQYIDSVLSQKTSHEVYYNRRTSVYEVFDMEGFCVCVDKYLENVLTWAMRQRVSMYITISFFPMWNIGKEA